MPLDASLHVVTNRSNGPIAGPCRLALSFPSIVIPALVYRCRSRALRWRPGQRHRLRPLMTPGPPAPAAVAQAPLKPQRSRRRQSRSRSRAPPKTTSLERPQLRRRSRVQRSVGCRANGHPATNAGCPISASPAAIYPAGAVLAWSTVSRLSLDAAACPCGPVRLCMDMQYTAEGHVLLFNRWHLHGAGHMKDGTDPGSAPPSRGSGSSADTPRPPGLWQSGPGVQTTIRIDSASCDR